MTEKGIADKTAIDIRNFTRERNWEQFHNPKDMAISISLEAAELLEVFQWSGQDVEASNKRAELEEELADVLICSIQLAQVLNLDMDAIIAKKMAKNRAKYPVEKSYGSAKKYTEL